MRTYWCGVAGAIEDLQRVVGQYTPALLPCAHVRESTANILVKQVTEALQQERRK